MVYYNLNGLAYRVKALVVKAKAVDERLARSAFASVFNVDFVGGKNRGSVFVY